MSDSRGAGNAFGSNLASPIAGVANWQTATQATPGQADALVSEMGGLQTAGLAADEAFIIAAHRITPAFTAAIWETLRLANQKELIGPNIEPDTLPSAMPDTMPPASIEPPAGSFAHDAAVTNALIAKATLGPDTSFLGLLGFAFAAGIGVRLLMLPNEFRLVLNVALVVLPLLASYFMWVRRLPWRFTGTLLGCWAVLALVINLYPNQPGYGFSSHLPMTWTLTLLHLPILLWLLMGVAYTGGDWQNPAAQMSFVRFTGETAIFLILIAIGGGLLMGLTGAVFSLVTVDPFIFFANWLLPFAIPGALFVAAWLAARNKPVAGHMAPILARIFTPLTAVMLVATLVVLLASGSLVAADRYLLILMDAILVLVLALVLYATSARDPFAQPGAFDWLQFGTIVIAFLVNLVALAAMITRIAEYGASANKTAALGLNILLFIHLIGAGVSLFQFLRHRADFSHIERWQTQFLPVYAWWAGIVVLIFPLIFRFA